MRIGIDLASIERIENLLRRFGVRGLKRFLTPDEIRLYGENPQRIASAWAAKEAFSKALGAGIGGDCSFLDMEFLHTPKGVPFLRINQETIKKFRIIDHSLSITHEKGFVIAAILVLCA